MDQEEELSDEELDSLPISIVIDGCVKTFANTDEMENYLYTHGKTEV